MLQKDFFDSIGQSEKNSVRVYVFRFALKLGHCSTQPELRICADSVAKVFLRDGTLILRAVGAAIENDVGDHVAMRQTHRRFR